MAVTVKSVWMQELTWRDVEDYLEADDSPTVLVPIGSTEQHGPHLPLGVDAYQAIDVSEGIAEATGVLVAPPIWYGDASHHLAFPGTIALSGSTIVTMLMEVYESLIHHGFENILTVNGHRIANLPAINIAAKQTRDEYPEPFIAAIDVIRFAVRAYHDLRAGDEQDGMHGGEFETSHMLAFHPGLVVEDEFTPEISDRWTRFASSDYTRIDDSVGPAPSRHDWAADALGHQGDPTKASVEKGEALFERLVENGVEFVEDLREMRTGDGEFDLSY